MTDKSITVWGDQSVDETRGIETLRKSYGLHHGDEHPFGYRFTIGGDAAVYALVKGDMGCDATHIVIRRDDILALVSDWPEYIRKDVSDQAIADAYARGVADARKVKPLVWECEAGWRWKGSPPEGFFRSVAKWVWETPAGKFKHAGSEELFDTLEAAKAAAQADYERRIQSSLLDL